MVYPWFFFVEYLGYFIFNVFIVFYEHGLITYYYIATCANPRECSKKINLSKFTFTYFNIGLLSFDLVISQFAIFHLAKENGY
jgi:hypothetical protein